MNPSLFDWRAVPWATLYPDLDPQKVVTGVDSGCVSCTIIYAAFQSLRIDLRTSHIIDTLSLFQKDKKGSLLAMATLKNGSCISVELYTVQGELLLACPKVSLDHAQQTCEWIANRIYLSRLYIFTMEYHQPQHTSFW
jgi:hypothetical protein